MLDPAQERRLAELFQQALALPASEREALLARCRKEDSELAGALAGLLREDLAGTRGVLERDVRHPAPEPERRLGGYRILRLLGEGGMGCVYLAEQTEPVQRMVAVKSIRIGGGPELLTRFEAERAALARLSHPNVAEIYAAGTADSGLPWFSMEYCPGPPLKEHCDRERATVATRIALLREVCDGVQHAHLRGVIHGDLKPGNVLVVQRDGRAVPKIIDFGLARAVAGRLAAGESGGETVEARGTWPYMSPEQVDPRGDFDSRTDVWSLGAMLYELLCGTLPFSGDSAKEVVERILHEGPVPPSTLISGLEPRRRAEVCAARRCTPQALVRALSGDLDAIALKALEHDRSRRYLTAAELSADLGRHLADEPVSAHAQTARYRLGKLWRRQRLLLGAAGLTLLALIGGLAFGWVQAARARDAERARLAGVQGVLAASAAREELVQLLLLEGPDVPARELALRAEPRLERLYSGDPFAEAVARRALGALWLEMGEPARAREQLERAVRALSSPHVESEVKLFLALDDLIRATRAEGLVPRPEEIERCVALALSILEDEDPALARALATLLDETRESGAPSQSLRRRIAAVAALLPRTERRPETAAPVTRLLAEAARALQLRGNSEELEQISRALEELARLVLDPNGIGFLYFLWHFADVHLAAIPPMPERAAELADELLARLGRWDLGAENWLRREASRIREAANSGR